MNSPTESACSNHNTEDNNSNYHNSNYSNSNYNNSDFSPVGSLKKSQSLGTMLNKAEILFDHNYKRNDLDETLLYDQSNENAGFNSFDRTDKINPDSLSSLGSPEKSPNSPVHAILKSHSAVDFTKIMPNAIEGASPESEFLGPRSKSFENLSNFESVVREDEKRDGKEFHIKRIVDWINQIEINGDMIVEEQGESSNSKTNSYSYSRKEREHHQLVASNGGVELAYNYISGLNPLSSAAQLANLGLVSLPVLTAFAGLRVVNLSGNSIVRVTTGALPKGLHMLNLSKNCISVIEGLRDLTRLRVLDLSYNRISRIGHGLASCSSLKELYLAGNKISEIEGLHRLLKLKILDLRANKISTAKGLGQLAANYSSLESINLENNPAQKNVGDEHLKKHILGLLPTLVYYNKQALRASGSKDLRVISSHKPSLRSGQSKSRVSRTGTTSTSGMSKSKSKNVRFTYKQSGQVGNNGGNTGKRVLGLEIKNPLRRIQSEGAF